MTSNDAPAYTYAPRRPANNSNMKWGLGLGVGLILLAFVAYTGYNAYTIFSTKAEGQQVFDQFMHTIAAGDYDAAYAYTASDFPRDEMDKIRNSNVRFSYYRSFQANPQFRFSRSEDTDTTVAFTGRIDYGTRGQGTFGVNMRKVGDRWLIYNVSLAR